MKWICPVCKKENEEMICSSCGFDESENYEKYGVISKLGKKDKDNYEQAQQRKKKAENDIQLLKTEETLKEISKEVQIKIPIEKSDYVTKHELLKEACVATTRKTNSNIKKKKHKKLKLIAISTFVFIFAFIFMLTVFIGIFNKKNDNEDKESIENVLMSDNSKGSDTATVLGSNIKRNTIKTITFLNSDTIPPDSWDVSKKQDKSVMAWVHKINGHLYIAGDGGVQGSSDCSCLFNGYTSLKKLDLSEFSTSNVTEMGFMFSNCELLTSLDLSEFDTSNVTNMMAMFQGCKALENIDLSEFNTSKVTEMGFMFSCCESLTKLDLSKFDTSNVTDMADLFQFCESLTNLNLSGFNTSKVTNMEAMFRYCRVLPNLDISHFNYDSLTNDKNMFENCSATIIGKKPEI